MLKRGWPTLSAAVNAAHERFSTHSETNRINWLQCFAGFPGITRLACCLTQRERSEFQRAIAALTSENEQLRLELERLRSDHYNRCVSCQRQYLDNTTAPFPQPIPAAVTLSQSQVSSYLLSYVLRGCFFVHKCELLYILFIC